MIFHAVGQLRPFSLLRRDLAQSVGFAHPSGDPSSPLTMLRGIVASDAHVLVGGELIEPGLSYGIALRRAELRRASGAIEPVATFSITGESFTMTGVFAQPFWVGGGAGAPGVLELAQLPLMDLDAGDVLVLERAIRVSERADVASVTDAYFAEGARVSGRVDDPSARIHVATAAGAPVSEVRPGADGAFSLRLPRGRLSPARGRAGRPRAGARDRRGRGAARARADRGGRGGARDRFRAAGRSGSYSWARRARPTRASTTTCSASA